MVISRKLCTKAGLPAITIEKLVPEDGLRVPTKNLPNMKKECQERIKALSQIESDLAYSILKPMIHLAPQKHRMTWGAVQQSLPVYTEGVLTYAAHIAYYGLIVEVCKFVTKERR